MVGAGTLLLIGVGRIAGIEAGTGVGIESTSLCSAPEANITIAKNLSRSHSFGTDATLVKSRNNGGSGSWAVTGQM